ncbi:hypothetical protein PHISP_06022 [Aspergillus sp. HF37]|nr:hypothetical protein PHISP_06022 [Aspergillus sp. HF37]
MALSVPENPFQRLIKACNDSPVLAVLLSTLKGRINCIQAQLQEHYEAHRTSRNAQYRARILSSDFPGWQVDEILRRLHESSSESDAPLIDTRNNLSFWARPPRHIRDLIAGIQEDIRTVAPTLWFAPPEYLHTTVLEIASSRTPAEVDALVSRLSSEGADARIASYTLSHRTHLVNPVVTYDAMAMALSFVPAADDAYSYHHLRRDVFDQVVASEVEINSRYAVPSAHITIARFITQDGFQREGSGPDARCVDSGRVRALIESIDGINERIRGHWGMTAAEWVVGHEKGLDLHGGRTWYGGGEAIMVGQGFGDVEEKVEAS